MVWIALIRLKWGYKFAFNLNAVIEPLENKLCDIRTGHIVFFRIAQWYNMVFFVYGNALATKRVEEKPHGHSNLWGVANIRLYIYMLCISDINCTDWHISGKKACAGHIRIYCLTHNTENIKYIRNSFSNTK